MKKLLDLTNQVLLTGRGASKWVESGGIWDRADGLNPFIDHPDYRGLLAHSASVSDLTSSVILGTPIAYAVWPTEYTTGVNVMYVMDDDGYIYRVNDSSSPTNLRVGTAMTTPRAGMAVMRPRHSGATTYTLLYAREGYIGTYDGTTFNDTAFNCNTNADDRPFHKMFDTVFYGNRNYVGKLYDDGTATIAHDDTALDLRREYLVTSLADDGRYLAIGATTLVDSTNNAKGVCKVLFWDRAKSSWDWEVTVPTSRIYSMTTGDGFVTVHGNDASYTVAFGNSEAVFLYAHNGDEVETLTDYAGLPYASAKFKEGVIFGNLATAITKPFPGHPRVVYNPIAGWTGSVSMLVTDFVKGKIFIGTKSNKLYSISITGIGAGATEMYTKYIPLKRETHIERLEIELPNGIGGSDQIDIVLYGDGGDKTVTLRSITQANYGDKHFLRIPLPAQLTTTNVKVGITFAAGVPTIASMSLWGHEAH